MNIKSNILFVDDETFSSKMIRRAFLDKPYNLFFATNGKEALEILSKEEIKVIITDLEMPILNGTALIKLVQKTYPNIVKIILSGNIDIQNILYLYNNTSIFKCLVKPLHSNTELFTMINEGILQYDENVKKENQSTKL